MLTLSQIKGVGDATIKKLQELDIKSVFELFSFLPSKYIDLQSPISVLDAEPGVLSLFEGRVEKVSGISPRGKRAFTVSFSDNIAQNKKIFFKATIYNMPFLHNSVVVGTSYRLLGRLSKDEGVFNIVNPQIEQAEKISKLQNVFTVYPLKGIIGQNTFKNIIFNALEQMRESKFEGRLAQINSDLIDKFFRLHDPISINDAELAKEELAAIDLALVLSIHRKLPNTETKIRKVFYNLDDFRIDIFNNSLSFEPTPSQIGAFEDIISDITSYKNMSRIVSGDVGSGKTVAAFFAMIACAVGGRQSVLMVPTEILAKQHIEKFATIAHRYGVSYTLLTSSVSEAEKKTILQGIDSGETSCVIGTQSLISKEVNYKNLALAVIDEQHKFGVKERRLLEDKGAIDILSLTATPIPRSMALTFYNDIAISYIKKREDAQTNIITSIVNTVAEGVNNIVNACKNGKQAFIVCPSIVDAEGYSVMSIDGFIKDYGHCFDGLGLQILHGKLSSEEKSYAMNEFASGNSKVLVATTVVEVGIDTLASEILILGADRFGLASLHQLRGRVGRDGKIAHCYVQSDSRSDKAESRLKLFCKHNDGQYLAEADFSMRGAGDFIGTRQSGSSVTPLFGLKMTADILASAKSYADKNLMSLSIDDLTALTRRSKVRIESFLNEIGKVTLNS